jgi:hypothetical protein
MSVRSPGPWYLAPEKAIGVDGTPVSLVVDAQEQPVANCGSGDIGELNAQLVACAPLLLQVVIAAYREVDTPQSEWHSKWVRDAEVLLGHLGELP